MKTGADPVVFATEVPSIIPLENDTGRKLLDFPFKFYFKLMKWKYDAPQFPVRNRNSV